MNVYRRAATVALRRTLTCLLACGLLLSAVACGAAAANTPSNEAAPVTLRLGYLPNLTHASALVGVSNGYFQRALGSSVTLKTQTFNAGPDVVTAMFGGALDAAFFGPSPAVDGFVKSHGEAIRIVSGATTGGAGLVVRPLAGINSPADLRGKSIATPQLGNTQDVALRAYLASQGMHTTPQGGGDVKIINAANSTIVTLFQQGQIDGAWVPEPYESRLVDDAGGRILVDESTQWPNGRFPTTLLVVTTSFLTAHPDVVARLIKGNLAAIDWINANPSAAQTAVDNALLQLTGKTVLSNVLSDAWGRMQFGPDPVASAFNAEEKHAVDAGLEQPGSIKGLFDLRPLNQLLRQEGRATVSDAGLGPS